MITDIQGKANIANDSNAMRNRKELMSTVKKVNPDTELQSLVVYVKFRDIVLISSLIYRVLIMIKMLKIKSKVG